MINPYNEKDIYNAVINVLNNENLSSLLKERKGKSFTWESTAENSSLLQSFENNKI